MADEVARGKVKATELKDVHANFISIVSQGANGETFEIFRVAGNNEDAAEAPVSDEDTTEERSVLRWLQKKFGIKTQTKEDGMSDEKKDKGTELLERVLASIEDMKTRIEKLEGEEKPTTEEKPKEEPKEEPKPEEPKPEAPAEGTEKTETEKKIEELEARVEKLANARVPSNAMEDGSAAEVDKDAKWRGTFLPKEEA